MSTTLSLRLTEDLAQWIEEQSRVSGRSRGSLVREALERERQQATRPFLALAGVHDGPRNLSTRRGFSKS
jgi:predicted DNA-binding protein